jgi:spermidine synthase
MKTKIMKPFKQQDRLLVTTAGSLGTALATEFLLARLSSYLLGSEALAYGMVVTGFLAAMAVGNYSYPFLKPATWQRQLQYFLGMTYGLALLAGLLPLALFVLFAIDFGFWWGLCLATLVLGAIVGGELAWLSDLGIFQRLHEYRTSKIFTLSYLVALLAALAIPVLLLPWLDIFPTAALIGILAAGVAVFVARSFFYQWRWQLGGGLLGIFLYAVALGTLPFSDRISKNPYNMPVVRKIAANSYDIALTRERDDLRLYIDGDLQFSTSDAYRYYESLIHPAAIAAKSPQRVLLLGRGTGMALSEILKWESVEQVILMVRDSAMVEVATNYAPLRQTHHSVLNDPRVEIRYGETNVDTINALSPPASTFDLVIANLPEPDSQSNSEVYTREFYQAVGDRLSPTGVFATQATNPFFTPKVFSCIAKTLEATGFVTYPYTASVPSLGIWGFVVATPQPFDFSQIDAEAFPVKTQFLTPTLLPSLFQLPADLALQEVSINTHDNSVITNYYSDRRWQPRRRF